ncbi:MAG: bifunctional 2-C-methyl-D-erythritol 4-phosphate cytidylyltransferase/2-C-methyl-D-erythritol 2,4-cyclodiphosphate synthase [Pseudomonadota bacterium]
MHLPSKARNIALIVAAGRGARAGAGGPKQYRELSGQTVIARTITAFLRHEAVDAVRVVIHCEDTQLYQDATKSIADHAKLLSPVTGGAERQDSVRLGLESLSEMKPDTVLIHDAARPFVDDATIQRVVDMAHQYGGAIAALPVFDTLKKSGRDASTSLIEQTVARDGLWRAQTPQGFHFDAILDAHSAAKGRTLTDDAAVAEAAGLKVALVAGSPDNMKITQAEDFGMAETLLGRNKMVFEIRTGNGYDVHAFEPGNAVILCGVEIPHTMKLKGHSDADVGMHAITDAILGAIGEGDIGDHFPPSDPQWKGAASDIFLRKARDLVAERNGIISNCDVTIICETPKIGPHRTPMRNAIAEILNIAPDRVSVKATTSEKLGFTGRGEGIAAIATASIRLPCADDERAL